MGTGARPRLPAAACSAGLVPGAADSAGTHQVHWKRPEPRRPHTRTHNMCSHQAYVFGERGIAEELADAGIAWCGGPDDNGKRTGGAALDVDPEVRGPAEVRAPAPQRRAPPHRGRA